MLQQARVGALLRECRASMGARCHTGWLMPDRLEVEKNRREWIGLTSYIYEFNIHI